MATLTELIRQEDPKRPYTDEQLAQMLQLRREQVVELRLHPSGNAGSGRQAGRLRLRHRL